MPPIAFYYAVPVEITLKPGEEAEFGREHNKERQARFAVEPLDWTERLVQLPTLRILPGKYTFLYEGFLTSHPKLATPSLPLEIVEQKTDSDPRVKPTEKLEPQKPVVQPRPNRPYTIGEIDSRMLLDLGNRFDVEVVGSKEGIVCGTDVYFIDSDLATAAVHAGLVKPGEKAIITVIVVKCPDEGKGTAQNGVKSIPWTRATVQAALILQKKP